MLFSTEIVPCTRTPLSGYLHRLSSCPLYMKYDTALGDAHNSPSKQKYVNCYAMPHVIFLYGMRPLKFNNINCSLTSVFPFLTDN